MARLDKSINDINKIIVRRVQENKLGKSKKIREWKGKKLFKAEKWRKMVTSSDDVLDVLDYIPDSYVGHPFIGLRNYEGHDAAIEEWSKTYDEYLEHIKDRKFGREKCINCLLNPKFETTPKCFRGFMINGLREEMNPTFPCNVLNIFKCPYGEKKNILFYATVIWQVLHEALKHARFITSEFDDTYHIDYVKKLVGSSPDNLYHATKDSLERIILPTVPIRTKNDIYEILRSKKKLGDLINQFADSIENKSLRTHPGNIGQSDFEVGWIREVRKEITDFVYEIKNSIKIEEMGDLYVEGFTEWQGISSDTRQKSGTCVLCGKAARIHCVNCDSWVCLDHWKEHGIKEHGYVENTELV